MDLSHRIEFLRGEIPWLLDAADACDHDGSFYTAASYRRSARGLQAELDQLLSHK